MSVEQSDRRGPYAASMSRRVQDREPDQMTLVARGLAVVLALVVLLQPTFDRADFLAAMNRLHQFYMAPEGLQRPNGLSIAGGPDFEGIAAWIFDVYLACRSSGRSTEDSWNEVVAWITQSDEWKVKHPGQPSQTPQGCKTTVPLESRRVFSGDAPARCVLSRPGRTATAQWPVDRRRSRFHRHRRVDLRRLSQPAAGRPHRRCGLGRGRPQHRGL